MDQDITTLRQGDFDMRQRAASRLADKAQPAALDALIQALADESWPVRASVVTAIGKVYYHNKKLDPARVLPQLSTVLRAKEPGLKINTIRSLGWIGDPGAIEAIRPLLEDEDTGVRSEAIKTLGILGDKTSIDHFANILQRHPDPWARYDAAGALGNIKDIRAVEPLLAALNDPAAQVRRTVASALSHLGDLRAVEPLIKQLRDPDPDARYWAVLALATLKDRRALPELERMSKHDREFGNGVRLSKVAASALKLIQKQTGQKGLLTRLVRSLFSR